MASRQDDTFDPNLGAEQDDSDIVAQHKFEANFSLYHALGVEEFKEELEYKTWCSKSSSWDIEIRMEKEIPFNNFNIFVTLRRSDLSHFMVEGILLIWFLNIEGRKCPIPYRLECAVDGRGAAHEVFAVDQHYRCLLREDDYLTFPDDVLVVKVQLFVKSCCEFKSDVFPLVLREGDCESKMLCSPKL
ncbi:hypothetical protein AVEN_121057-1 [Araneus ventricosus]|uniref:Uncharacterized protein n=1 Tax=Araneus ventricosus TaxID=182803 RepID=A0A4Y2EY56_ARAVE|nr:hypothetical protein AVEN_246335-1 [Araneus ventricosus]GBM34192.1 hypothetical protein AVEN_121057-1 [Araneus ventricosus]